MIPNYFYLPYQQRKKPFFYQNIEKKHQSMKFFESYPFQYRVTNKALRKRAGDLRQLDLLTDITIYENDLIMYLRYKNNSNGSKIIYEYEIDPTFDPFDKDDQYSLTTQASKTLNKTIAYKTPIRFWLHHRHPDTRT